MKAINNICMMAFGKGTESKEATEVKRYIGVAPVYVLGVNSNKAELEKLYNTTLDKEPEYMGSIKNENGDDVPNVRIDFIVKSDAEKCNGIDMLTKIPFFIRKDFRFNKDKSKIQVIDKYGRTAWVTKEQLQNHEIPMYSNGPANLDKDYRPAYIGEEALTQFLIAYLNIPSVMKYVNGTWVMNENTSDSEARLDHIEDYFKGNFSELKGAVSLQPNNKVKALFGVRTTDDNKQYQSVFTEMFLKNNVKDYSKLDKTLKERKDAGAYSTTDFEVCDLKEYNIQSTDFNNNNSAGSNLPFDTPSTSSPWDLYVK